MAAKRNAESHKPDKQAAADVMFDALVRLEEKLMALRTLNNFDREILTIIGPALNAARGVRKSHSADF
jgi:adenylate cyclase class IV